MDQIFDRLGNLLKSILQDGDAAPKTTGGRKYGDQDMADAWEELDDFLNEEEPQQSQNGSSTADGASRRAHTAGRALPKELVQDYANLEVPAGAPMEEVRKSYKRLLVKYHPDRHASNPERFETATKVTQKINESFQRIKKYQQSGTT